VFLAAELGQPVLVEGEAGVGKTEVAKALAAATGARLIRLQCHEGIDVPQALYDWDYARQLLALRAAEHGVDEGELFSRRFLLRRPLLEALEASEPVVLLIDEIDRADDEFEAFLLELLSDFQVTIPELGTVTARERPLVVLTSNRTRELHDALKRRCLYHWIEYPVPEREAAIVRARVPGAEEAVVARVVAASLGCGTPSSTSCRAWGRRLRGPRALGALGEDAALDDTLGRRAEGARGRRPRARRGDPRRCLRSPSGSSASRGRCAPAASASGPASSSPRCARWAPSTRPRPRRRGSRCAPSSARAARTSRSSTPRGASPSGASRSSGRSTLPPPVASPALPRVAAPFSEGPQGALDREPVVRPAPYSEVELLHEKDFAHYTDAERAAARALIAQLARRGPRRRSRRLRAVRHRGVRPDLGRTVRRSLHFDGEPVDRRWRDHATAPRKLVLVCDVSGSMAPYARVLLQYLQAAVASRKRVEAFAFGTRLTRLTRELAGRDPDRALERAAAAVSDWSGGTRIGAAVGALNREHGRRLGRGSVVVILSDGWDRGDPEIPGGGDGAAAALGAPRRLAEPAQGGRGLRAARPRDGRGPAAHRPLPGRQLARLAGRARVDPRGGPVTGAVVLAAGAATRFGSPKQLARLDGRPLLQHALDATLAVPAIDRTVLVLGAHAESVRAGVALGAAEVVVCRDWEHGLSASLRCGLRALAGRGARRRRARRSAPAHAGRDRGRTGRGRRPCARRAGDLRRRRRAPRRARSGAAGARRRAARRRGLPRPARRR
jgi:hypothetical protein